MSTKEPPYPLACVTPRILTDAPAMIDKSGALLYSSKTFLAVAGSEFAGNRILPRDVALDIITGNCASSGCFAKSGERTFCAFRFPPDSDSALIYPAQEDTSLAHEKDRLSVSDTEPVPASVSDMDTEALPSSHGMTPAALARRLFSADEVYRNRIYCSLPSLLREWVSEYGASFDAPYVPQISCTERIDSSVCVRLSPVHFFSMITALSDLLILSGASDIFVDAGKRQGCIYVEISADCGFCRFVSSDASVTEEPAHNGSYDLCKICIELCAKACGTRVAHSAALLGEKAFSITLDTVDYDKIGLKAVSSTRFASSHVRDIRALYSGSDVIEKAKENVLRKIGRFPD